MRRWIAALFFILAALGPAAAYDPEQQVALDRLFASLATSDSAAAARAIDAQIWAIWLTPTDPALAERMQEASEARAARDLVGLRRLLDAIVVDFPDYAEGWNQRATVAFMLGDYEDSLADIDEVLKREPRHFGALSGQAMIYNLQGRRSLAVDVMRKALLVHPFLAGKDEYPELDPARTRA